MRRPLVISKEGLGRFVIYRRLLPGQIRRIVYESPVGSCFEVPVDADLVVELMNRSNWLDVVSGIRAASRSA